MHITSKGQVTIPMAIRENMGFLPNTEIEFRVEKNRVYLEKVENKMTRGEAMIQQLRGKGDVKMTTDEIMALTRGDD
jgi:AbrB family looped-hinge helix DNA binding protein